MTVEAIAAVGLAHEQDGERSGTVGAIDVGVEPDTVARDHRGGLGGWRRKDTVARPVAHRRADRPVESSAEDGAVLVVQLDRGSAPDSSANFFDTIKVSL